MSTPTLQTEAPAPTTTAPAPAPKLRKVSFGKAAVKKEESKTAYPVFQDEAVGAQVTAIAERIKKRDNELKALEGAQKTDKAELKMFVAPYYFRVNQRKLDPPSSIAIPSPAGEVLVTFQNRYPALEDESALLPILGDKAEQFLRQSFTLNIKGEELPVGKEQQVVDDVIAVLEKHGAAGALEVKEQIKPTPDFHVARLTHFTPEQNMQIEQVWPITAMIKTKGRG